MARNILNLLIQVAHEEGLTPAQQRAFIATARQESGLNPRAVGDGGTSYGLFQHHVGGAGGSTHEQARRYLNPMTSARERAKWFRSMNIRGGAGAAALQRPADPTGYARSVDTLLGRSPSTGSSPGGTPRGSSQDTRKTQPQSDAQSQRAEWLGDYLYNQSAPLGASLGLQPAFSPGADPMLQSLLQSGLAPAVVASSPGSVPRGAGGSGQSGRAGGSRGGGGDFARRSGEESWQYLQRIGQTKFGLKNDAGNSQTTGGRHMRGSAHYRGGAVDFGDAKNSWTQLNAWYAWLNKHKKQLGITQVLNEGDHIHAAI